MRTSRLSKETASLVGKMAGGSSSSATPSSPPRRTTRSSLARFAYTSDASAAPSSAAVRDIVLANDIEDAVPSTSRKRRRVAGKTEVKEEEGVASVEGSQTTSAESKPTPARKRKPARVIKGVADADTKVEPPSDWEEMYTAVKEMRLHGAARDAAVDTMGCERLFHPDASERDRRFHILIALMLSSQTKDTVNAVAMKRLMTELPPCEDGKPGGLNLENILAVEPALLNELIWAVGFHNNKTKYIKAAAEILRDKFDSDVPDTIEGLTSLPGVGPKMGYLCLSAAWDRTEGIGVDVHVHRITNLWGWHKTTQPEATRAALQSWLPRDRWREINWLLVGLGQTVCLPVGRRCGDCELGLRGLCKAAERKKVIEGRKRREVKVEEDGDVVVKTEVVEEEEVLKEEVVNEAATESAPKAEVNHAESEECKPEEAADAPRKRRGRKG